MTAADREALFLRPAEAAALAGLSTRAIYRAIERGKRKSVERAGEARGRAGDGSGWVRRVTVAGGEGDEGALVSRGELHVVVAFGDDIRRACVSLRVPL
jgi:hypothetical protein